MGSQTKCFQGWIRKSQQTFSRARMSEKVLSGMNAQKSANRMDGPVCQTKCYQGWILKSRPRFSMDKDLRQVLPGKNTEKSAKILYGPGSQTKCYQGWILKSHQTISKGQDVRQSVQWNKSIPTILYTFYIFNFFYFLDYSGQDTKNVLAFIFYE